jgi:DNA ligase (NAD+)
MSNIPKWLQDEMDYLDKQSDLYYNNGDSEISDAEFDKRRDVAIEELLKHDKSHRFLFKVGTAIPDKTPWQVVKHEYPLGSQAKVQTLVELDKWYKGKYGRKLVVQEKLDGISISLIYDNGKLVDAITRGDGFEGESILRNIERIPNVPKKIKFLDKLAIRGEVLLPKSAFVKYDLPYKNARNGCSGIAKNFDGIHASLLKVLVYTVQNSQDFGDIKTEQESLDFLRDQGFETVTCYHTSLQGIHDLYNDYASGKRGSLDHDIDGLVIKANQIDMKNFDFSLNDWRRPKNQIALKFAHDQGITIMEDIEASTNGEEICPVAVLKAIDLAGVTITRASLANWKLAIEKNFSIGAEVLVSRRNDVIPHVEKVIKAGHTPIQIPTECPVCKSKVAFDRNEAGEELSALICLNPECKTKLFKNISKWLAAHNVKNVGESFIHDVIDHNLVDSLASFLNLPYNMYALDKLKAMDGYGTRKLNIVTKGIESTFKTNILQFLHGMNFRGIGKERISTIMKICKPEHVWDFFKYVKSDDLFNQKGFGREIVISLRKQIYQKREQIKEVAKLVKIAKNEIVADGILSDKSICITGELYSMSRPKAQELVKQLGGKASSSVSSKTTYLVSNDPTSTTGKMKKARENNVPIITEKEFLKMIGKEDLMDNVQVPDKKDTKPAKSPAKKVTPKNDNPQQPDLFDINDL